MLTIVAVVNRSRGWYQRGAAVQRVAERCRNTLALVEAAGFRPDVVDYLSVGRTKPQLLKRLAAMGAKPRDILRQGGTPAAELDLLDVSVGDDTTLAAMVARPILVNRPIVATPKGVKITRPSEAVLTHLDAKPTTFTKEDGEELRFPTEAPCATE
ncbi:ArsC/Spx/MgsR family protein [Phenylobacterium immobile]|uniref:ArsC/Spx/MgsR family protein n=1 Tax=Phenylobacterium immobile TaxID=21 RepID=UPI000B859A5B|nr:ArsC/Spx/MgsR family protein [Phenylobacterium immobile]